MSESDRSEGRVRAVHQARRSVVGIDADTSKDTVAVLPVPAGDWLLTGKVVLTDGGRWRAGCRLSAGGVLGATDNESAIDGRGPTIAFQATVSRAAAFEVRIRCTKESGEALLLARHARLTAVRVDRVVVDPYEPHRGRAAARYPRMVGSGS